MTDPDRPIGNGPSTRSRGRHLAPRGPGRRRPPLWIPVLLTLIIAPIAIVRLTSANGSDGPGAAASAHKSGTTNSVRTISPPGSPAAAGQGSAPGPSASASPGGNIAQEPPPCSVSDRPAEDVDYDDWAGTLLDTSYRLPSSYQPPDLEPVEEAGFPEEDLMIRSFVVDDLRDLRDAAEDAGHPIDLVAAYRSYWEQKDLFDRRSENQGDAAANKTARPGHSEHQLGTTIDVKRQGTEDVTQGFGSTPTGLWLLENAPRFGFVQSYPADRHDVTCYAYEPWHFRYLGRSEAAQEAASGLTLREFLWRKAHPAR